MRVAIVSDHAGFELKEAVKPFLAAEHVDGVDFGTHISRALVEGLSAQQSDAEFNALLNASIQSVFDASNW